MSNETKQMSIEQLLIPRYKVLCGYPNSPFRIGEILTLDELREGKPYTRFYRVSDEIDEKYPEQFLDTYPTIFRRMNWSEGRSMSELPKYVRMTCDTVWPFRNGVIAKMADVLEDISADIDFLGNCSEPATLAEYEAFKNQQK